MKYLTSSSPLTRKQIAAQLGISTKTLDRFIKKVGITVPERVLISQNLASKIIRKYQE